MKRLLSFCCAFFLLCAAPIPARAEEAGLPLSAEAAILYEPVTGAVLTEKNADERLPMASTTKIMTALAALEALPLSHRVTIPEEACGVEGSGVGLVPGEVLTLEDLLWAVLLESANDAAAAVAFAVSGSIGAFADCMNEKAAELGLKNTHFVNPHGLDDEAHYTTARELALITARAMENEDFCRMVSTVRHEIPKPGGTRYLINHNRLLRECPGVNGVKTGFTKRSGRCLVSSAERDGVTLIAVTLKDPDDWRDHRAMYDAAFPRCRRVTLAEERGIAHPVPCAGSEKGAVSAVNREGLSTVFIDGVPEIRTVLETKRLLFPPVNPGDVIGRVTFRTAEGAEIGALELTAEESVEAPAAPKSLWEKLFGEKGTERG